MNRNAWALAGLLWLTIATQNSAMAECKTEGDGSFQTIDAYDPDAAPAKRLAAVEGLRLAADKCPEAAYDLGLLYRFGPDLQSNLLPKDTAKAEPLILAYAEAGFLPAYADLAEMALQDKRARDAMKWTQVYLYLRTHHSEGFNHKTSSFDRHGYNADLLLRSEAAWARQRPQPARSAITEDLRG